MTVPPRQSKPVAPPPSLELFYARGIAAAMLVVALLMGGHLYFILYALSHSFLTWPIALILGLAVAPMLVMPVVAGWRALRWDGPVLILDEDGITDHRRPDIFVPWKDIGDVNLNRPAGQLTLSVEFNDDQTARNHVRNPLLRISIVRYLLLLGHRNHGLGLLKCRGIEVIDTARALRQHSIRVRIREANRRLEVQQGNTHIDKAPAA